MISFNFIPIVIFNVNRTNQYSEHRKKIDTFKIKVKLLKYAHLLIRSNNINKEAPITCKIRINQPLFMFIIIYIIESEAIVKKSL